MREIVVGVHGGWQWSGTRLPPTARPSDVRPGPTALVPWARGCGCGGPSLTPQCTLLRAGVARCVAGMRAFGGGGGRLVPCEGCAGIVKGVEGRRCLGEGC